MAEGNGNQIQYWRAHVKAWVTSEDDNYAWVRSEAYFQSLGWGYSTYAQGKAGVGSEVSSWEQGVASAPKGGWVTQFFARKDVKVAKKDAASTVTCKGIIQLTGGYHDGTSTATCSVSIDARKKHPPSTPSTPTVERVLQDGSAAVKLTWSNNASNATGTRVWRETYGSGGETIRDGGAIDTFIDAPPTGGTYRYQVQNYNSDGNSGWSNSSDWIQPLAAPAAPTLLAPASGVMIDAASNQVQLTWQHNPVDGSAQTSAQLQWRSNAAWQSVNLNEEQSYSWPITFHQNSDIQWRVKTKGLFEDFSPLSETRMFRIRTSPGVQLADIPEITAYPVPIQWTFNDVKGTQANARISLALDDRVVWSKQIDGDATSFNLQPADFRLKNNKTYRIKLEVTSTTGLQGSTSTEFATNFTPPKKPSLELRANSNTLEVECRVKIDGGDRDIEQIIITRNNKVISESQFDGVPKIDALPPLDIPIKYTATAINKAGSAASISDYIVVKSDPCIMINYGDSLQHFCKLIGNVSTSSSRKIEKSTFQAANAKHPITTFGTHESTSGSFSGVAFIDGRNGSSIAEFEQLSRYVGKCVLRLPWGERHVVTLDVDIRRDLLDRAEISVNWEEIDDDSLL